MKKILSVVFLAIIMIACSKDDTASLDAPETAAITTSSNIDLDGIQPLDITPNAEFDNSDKGVYHGIVSASDRSLHGKIWINLENDGQLEATIISDEGEHIKFEGSAIDTNEKIINFEGPSGTFTYDVSNLNSPKATDVMINNVSTYIQTVKDRSDQRAAATLGTWVDSNDATFGGTWDLLTDGTTDGNPFGLPNLTQVCILGPGGAMFVDDVFETFGYPCAAGEDIISPVFHAAGGAFGNLNEFWAQDQNVTIGGTNLNYFIGQSTFVHNNNTTFVNPGFHSFLDDADDDPATPDVLACFVFENGQQGLWAWNGRNGIGTFDDPFAPVTRSNTSEDVEALRDILSNTTAQEADFSVFE